jgi:hypothetical protein
VFFTPRAAPNHLSVAHSTVRSVPVPKLDALNLDPSPTFSAPRDSPITFSPHTNSMPPPPPSGFSIGLGAAKKPSHAPSKSRKPLSAFATADDDDASGDDDNGLSSLASKSTRQPKKKGTKDVTVVNAQLATFNELSKKAEKAAAEVDPAIYDYDGVWDDMKSVDRKKKKLDEIDAIERKPKYMESLLASAEVRKRDQLKAKERMLQKEREEEGDEFQDKESFVTSAYKKQQEELRKLEEEERLREGMDPQLCCWWIGLLTVLQKA